MSSGGGGGRASRILERRGRFWVHAPAGVAPEPEPVSYAGFADVYDEALGDEFHAAFGPILDRALQDFPPPGRSAVDLGCGTGTLLLRLAPEGWRLQGIERDAGMLRVARRKLERSGIVAELKAGDVRDFRLAEPVDAAFAVYDTLNHLLTTQDLIRTFRAVAQALRPGGLLYADFSTRTAFRDVWGDPEPFVREGAGFRLEIRSRFDVPSRIGEAEVRVTREGAPDLPAGRVRQRFFLDEEIRGTMWAGGLDPVAALPFDVLPVEEAGEVPRKTLWIGRRR